jgi:uncharacterized membrane protein YeaQ/YmgE (transglycosylase-associated protein family)
MGWLVYLIVLLVQGLVFGALARLALPAKDPMSIPMTIALGIAGSFIGGLIVYLVSGGRSYGGFLAAFVCTVGLVYLVRRSRGGSVLSPDAASRERRERRGYR